MRLSSKSQVGLLPAEFVALAFAFSVLAVPAFVLSALVVPALVFSAKEGKRFWQFYLIEAVIKFS